jgi:PAS domain S-box-containing protein
MEPVLILLICASVALGWHVVRRPDSGPATHWVAGWIAAGSGSILMIVRDDFPHAQLLAYPLGTLFPALLLSGAFVLASRPIPRWLLPAALAFGAMRAGIAAAGLPAIALALSLAIDPFVVLAAAVVVHRAKPRVGAGRSQRWLAPSLVVLAALGAIHVIGLMRGEGVPPGLLAMWVVSVPPLFGVQLHAEWARGRQVLQRARDDLELRVEARTAELARANAALRQEVEERLAAERSLRESEERYRVVSELSSDLAFGLRTDLEDGLHAGWVTDAFTRITGYTIEELKGTGWVGLVHPDDLERTRGRFAAIFAGQVRDLEVRLVTKDGRVVTVDARLDVQRDPRDGSVRVMGAARDITEARRADEERRKLELHLLEAQRLESLAMLTGGVAHDFNNLLAVILGNGRMALAEASPDSSLYARLARIRTAAEHGARLTEQMLAYSGRSPVTMKPVELSHLVEEMVDLLRASTSERCRLELDLAPHAPVEGDGTQLQQIVLNLVTNASESLAGRDGTVRIRTGRSHPEAGDLAGAAGTDSPAPGSYAFLEVADDGPGMDAATKARIFEPFFTTKFPGRGLGLAAVLGIVRAHRGVVQVRSEPGRGTALRVLLPEASAPVAKPADAGANGAERRSTVLVVDDQDSVLEVAQAFLERAGHRVITALGGRAGIERFRARGHEIDAVLLDLAMPDADGEQVLLEMQRLRPDVRVIIATGYGVGSAAERIRAHGVAGFVCKPYEPEEILEQVDRALAPRI